MMSKIKSRSTNMVSKSLSTVIGQTGKKSIQTVDLRLVHEWLQVKTPFSIWVQRRVKEYSFIEGVDFAKIFHQYQASLNMAKQLCMVERNQRGRQARQYFIECDLRAKQKQQRSSVEQYMPYHFRRRIANQGNVPFGYFSILNELYTYLLNPLELLGYVLPDRILPDVSEGQMFCKWLRKENGVDPSVFPNYFHYFEDGRVVPARAYPLSLYEAFVLHLHTVWIPERLVKYFQERDKTALPFIKKAVKCNLIRLPSQKRQFLLEQTQAMSI
jgi:phage anti-repressor protein